MNNTQSNPVRTVLVGLRFGASLANRKIFNTTENDAFIKIVGVCDRDHAKADAYHNGRVSFGGGAYRCHCGLGGTADICDRTARKCGTVHHQLAIFGFQARTVGTKTETKHCRNSGCSAL